MNTRPKIGLALGAGGARGFAHIGIIEILIKNNIPIDFIAGSSIGAMVGGIFAATKNIEKMKNDVMRADWKQILSFIDPDLKNGIVGGKKIKNYIEDYIGQTTFDKLRIPFSAIATNFNNGKPVILNTGDVATAIRASISIPLVFKPIKINNTILTDGALSMPVPVKAVKQMGADIIIAVNLDSKYFTNKLNYDKLSFYKIMRRTLNILSHNLSLYNIESADIVLEPNVGYIRWNEFKDNKKTMEEGRKETEKHIKKILETIESKLKKNKQ